MRVDERRCPVVCVVKIVVTVNLMSSNSRAAIDELLEIEPWCTVHRVRGHLRRLHDLVRQLSLTAWEELCRFLNLVVTLLLKSFSLAARHVMVLSVEFASIVAT